MAKEHHNLGRRGPSKGEVGGHTGDVVLHSEIILIRKQSHMSQKMGLPDPQKVTEAHFHSENNR